jgi:hypothetical protein
MKKRRETFVNVKATMRSIIAAKAACGIAE